MCAAFYVRMVGLTVKFQILTVWEDFHVNFHLRSESFTQNILRGSRPKKYWPGNWTRGLSVYLSTRSRQLLSSIITSKRKKFYFGLSVNYPSKKDYIQLKILFKILNNRFLFFFFLRLFSLWHHYWFPMFTFHSISITTMTGINYLMLVTLSYAMQPAQMISSSQKQGLIKWCKYLKLQEHLN